MAAMTRRSRPGGDANAALGVLTARLPEHIALRYDIADIGTRFYAHLIDMALLTTLKVGLFILVSALSVSVNPYGYNWYSTVVVLVYFLLDIGFLLLQEWRMNGQTVGKSILGLRTVRDDGSALTFTNVLLRNLLRPVDGLPILNPLGLIAMLLSPRAQRLGDLAARTIVVRESQSINAVGLTFTYAMLMPAPSVAISGQRALSNEQVLNIRDFLQRMPQLKNAPALAHLLAEEARATLVDAADELRGMDDLSLLRYIDAATKG